MKVDAFLTGRLAEAEAGAAIAKSEGYDAVWSAELQHDPFLPLARAATSAMPMQIGTSIAVAFARTPMTVANTAWDLQALSGGRFILGLGSQVRAHIERRFSMPWSHPAPRMREYIQALLAIWDSWQNGRPLEFKGDFYTHTLMTPMFDPGPLEWGRPKVMLAGVGTTMTRVAGEVADGFLAHGFTTRSYMQEVTLPALSEALTRSGRRREDFEVKYSPFVATGRDEEEIARSIAETKERIAFYASTPAYRPVLEHHGWGDLQSDLNALARKGMWQEMGTLVDDEVLGEFALVATSDELPGALGRWVAGLADRTGFSTPSGVAPGHTVDMIAALRQAASRS